MFHTSKLRAVGGGHNFLIDEVLLLSLHTLPGESGTCWRDSTGKRWWTASFVPETLLRDRGEEDEEAFTAAEAGILAICNSGLETYVRFGEAILHICSVELVEELGAPTNKLRRDVWNLMDLDEALNVVHDGKRFVVYTKLPCDKLTDTRGESLDEKLAG